MESEDIEGIVEAIGGAVETVVKFGCELIDHLPLPTSLPSIEQIGNAIKDGVEVLEHAVDHIRLPHSGFPQTTVEITSNPNLSELGNTLNNSGISDIITGAIENVDSVDIPEVLMPKFDIPHIKIPDDLTPNMSNDTAITTLDNASDAILLNAALNLQLSGVGTASGLAEKLQTDKQHEKGCKCRICHSRDSIVIATTPSRANSTKRDLDSTQQHPQQPQKCQANTGEKNNRNHERNCKCKLCHTRDSIVGAMTPNRKALSLNKVTPEPSSALNTHNSSTNSSERNTAAAGSAGSAEFHRGISSSHSDKMIDRLNGVDTEVDQLIAVKPQPRKQTESADNDTRNNRQSCIIS